MRIYVIRHGQTLFNYLKRVQGWSDSPLTDLGILQAEAVGKHLSSVSFDAIYTSDLKRAVDTAKIISDKQSTEISIQISSLLREAYYGGFEGGSEMGPWKPVFKKYGYPVEKINTDFENTLQSLLREASNNKVRNIIAENDPMNLAENYSKYYNRINKFIREVIVQNDLQNVAVISHGGTSQLLLEILLDDTSQVTEVDNCSTSIVEIKNNQSKLIEFNTISYLEDI